MARPSSLYSDRKEDGQILFAVAWENHRMGRAGHVYVHAHTRVEALGKLLSSNAFEKDTKIVAVAAALGAHVELDEKDNVRRIIV